MQEKISLHYVFSFLVTRPKLHEYKTKRKVQTLEMTNLY